MSVETAIIEGHPRDEVRKPASGRPLTGSGGLAAVGPLVFGPRPERVYSHSLLLELKEHPLARQWPPYLDPVFKNARGVWDPDRWHLDRKRGETPVSGEPGPDAPVKERKESKKEKGGACAGLTPGDVDDLQQLVLSPQRKSFLSGCNSGSGSGDPEVSLRPEQPGAGNKRVGSGRLLTRPERGGGGGVDEERGYRRGGDEFNKRYGDNMRREQDKFGSGFIRRDREDEGGWAGERKDGGFFQLDDRRDGRRNMERPQRRRNEPEWMSETISHNDIIELRGFDDKPTKKKEVVQQQKGSLPLSVALGIKNGPGKVPPPGMPSSGINVEDLEQRGKPQNPRRKPSGHNDQNQNIIDSLKENVDALNNIDLLNDLGLAPKNADDQINFDQIMETMLGGDTMMQEQKAQPKSRFSQFFNKGAAGADPGAGKQDSRRSSIQDELLGANILKEINGGEGGQGPQVKIPSPSGEERYFAPISPAAQTRPNIMEMIQKGAMPPGPPHGNGNHQPPRVHDLEENLRRQLGLGGPQLGPMPPHHQQHPNIQELLNRPQNGQQQQPLHQRHPHPQQHPHPHQQQQPQDQQQQQDGMSAFKKLVAMVGQNPESNDQQALPFGPGVVRPSPLPPHGSVPTNAPTEQEILEQMRAGPAAPHKMTPPAPPQLPPPLANFLAGHPLNLELVARPEGKQLLVGLETGNFTIDHLVAQLSNPALQQRQRDVILSVLKLVTMQRPPMPPAPPFPGPIPPEMLLPGHNPANRVSPIMMPPGSGAGPTPGHLSISPGAQQARVPSPQEMTVLTQQIMQQALIKRKLEEQKENYRRKHGDQPLPTASASPLAFTPTSVMRKNVAERKDSDPAIKPVPELKISAGKEAVRDSPPSSPGRAITKGGNDDRPASLDLAGQTRRLSPHQMFPHQPLQPGPQHNPLMYLQNNPLAAPVSHSMLSQANAMAQQQLAASLIAQGLDPRQFINRLPSPGPPPAQPRPPHPGPPSPSRAGPPGGLAGVPPAGGLAGLLQGGGGSPQGGGGSLARFFSPEVLAAARSGNMPEMPPMPKMTHQMPAMPPQQQPNKVLTLEEIELQAAAVRM